LPVSEAVIFWLAVAALAATCLAALGARALAQFSPSELKDLCQRRKHPDRLGQILKGRDEAGLAAETLRAAATATYVVAAAYCIWTVFAHIYDAPRWPRAVSGGAVAALLLLTAEIWLPWGIARLWAEPFLYYTWPAWQALGALLFPFILAARFVDAVLERLSGRPPSAPDEESFEEDIRTIVSQGHREGLLQEDAREMIEGVIELSDVDVSQIMTPRTDIIYVPAASSWPEALQLVIQAGHTRIPVYGKNRDDIVGILYIKDLLPELAKPPSQRLQPWTRLLRQPVFVPETKPVNALLQDFQRGRHHMAVVLDEYGGVSGVVTLEDVLEEIVGEIVDEFDKDVAEPIRRLGEGAWESLARVHIDRLNEQLGLELPEDADFDTVGGFVFSELGHIPAAGEELVWRNVRITVLEASRRRIERVRIELLDGPRKT
jgi:CBS domain containing-hemolysin-like protein